MLKPEKRDEAALTAEALILYKELIAEYGRHLQWVRGLDLEKNEKHDQRLVIGLLAISVYNSAKAVAALYEARQGDASLIFVRSQFEQAAKAEYFSTRPGRARDFLDLEPFERYKLAEGYKIKESLRKIIVAECKDTVEKNPRLLGHQSKNAKKGKVSADFLAIREALKPPDMKPLLKALKWSLDLYVTIFLFGSLGIHGSINEMRKYIDQDAHSALRFQPEIDMAGPPDYLIQSTNYLFGFIGKIAEWFPGGNREAEVTALFNRQRELWQRIQAEDGPPTPEA